MFGHNSITGKKYFEQGGHQDDLLVTSVFYTIQGEGPYAGQPAVFVRLAMCNLACSFCDTFFDAGDWLSPTALINVMREAVGGCPVPDLVVVTGGEPTLQQHALPLLCSSLRKTSFRRVQIETNGILPVSFLPDWVTVVVSPKCAELEGRPTRYFQPSPAALARADCLKFILCGDLSSPYYTVPDWALERGAAVYVSPMAEYMRPPEEARALYGQRMLPDMRQRSAAERVSFWEPGMLDMEKCRRNYEYAAGYALKHGLRLSLQMHLFAGLP